MLTANEPNEIRLSGISASPGICIGKAYLVDQEGVDVIEKYFIEEGELNDERNRFKSAVKHATDELRAIISNTPEDLQQQTDILETHVVLLKDKMLYGRTLSHIEEELVNAEWALKTVVAEIKSMFSEMEDDYFRERVADIVHVSDRIMQNLMGAETVNLAAIRKRVILVASDLSPAQTSQIQLERIKGFVTDHGGKACHTSIIARTLEIPAVQGLENATRVIRSDDLIIVDGSKGVVIVHPEEQTLIEFEERQEVYEFEKSTLTRDSHLPAETLDGTRIRVKGNIELPEEVVAVHSYGGEGIGLYRSEFQYMGRPDFPTEFELYDKYKDVIEVMAPNPVTIRTLDVNGDKAISSSLHHDEANPALGLRGIRWCLKRQDVFRTQLRAILRAAVHGRVRIMFPMISTLAEIIEAKRHLNETADALEQEGAAFNRDVQVGILIEVPSAAIMADRLAAEVDFFSIGTNDLIQYTLAIDRSNMAVNHLFQPLDPAVLRFLKMVADVGRKQQIEVFMCGEMAAYPIHIPILLGMGLSELSMNSQAIPAAKDMIRKVKIRKARAFIEKVLDQDSANDVFDLVRDDFDIIMNSKTFC